MPSLSTSALDGFWCDVADGIPLSFWEEARDVCARVKGGIVILADARRHSIFGHSPDVTVDWANAATPAGRRRREMVRALAALRRDNPVMTAPGQTWLDNDRPESVLSLRRGESAANGIMFVGNFSKEPITVRVDSVLADHVEILLSNGATIDGEAFVLAPWGFAFARNKAK